MRKRLLAWLLTVTMTAGLFAVPVAAGPEAGQDPVMAEVAITEDYEQEEAFAEEADETGIEEKEPENTVQEETTDEFQLTGEVTGYGCITEETTEEPMLQGDEVCPTPQQVHNTIMAMQNEYPEGMPWTNNDFYAWNGGGTYYGGYGCHAFAMILSDAAFGSLQSRELYNIDISMVHPGDILRVNNDSHTVIVTDVFTDHVIIAEGNYNSSIHWGRSMSAASVAEADYLITRYPAGYFGNAYTVTLDARGGSFQTGESTLSFIVDEKTGGMIPDGAPKKLFSQFLGWATSRTAVRPACYPGEIITVTKDTTLYAMWGEMPMTTISAFPRSIEINSGEEVDRYYKIIPDATGCYTFESSGSADTVIDIYNAGFELIASADDIGGGDYNFFLETKLTKNEVYYVYVREFNGLYSHFTFTVNKIGNDSAIKGPYPTSYVAQMQADATTYIPFVPEETGIYTFESTGFYDKLIAVIDDGTNIASDDNSKDGKNFKLSVLLEAGTEYKIAVWYYAYYLDDPITINISYEKYTPVKITKQPADLTVKSGDMASFSIQAAGNGLIYQWQVGRPHEAWVDIDHEGLMTNTYRFKTTKEQDGWKYRCLVEDVIHQQAWSEEAVLHVQDGVQIYSQPQIVCAGVGSTASYTVGAGNVASYQWQYSKDGKNWLKSSGTGSTTATVSFVISKSNAANVYRCKLTGTYGDVVYSDIVGIDLIPGAKITRQPEYQVVRSGQQATFSITAINVPEDGNSYQWQYSKNGTNWYKSTAPGSDTSTLVVTATTGAQGNLYRCQVTGNDGNKVNSQPAGFIVVYEQPKTSYAKPGQNASFHVVADGIASYQWYYSKDNGVTWYKSNGTGATTDTLTFKVTSTNKNNIYRCKLETLDGNGGFTDAAGILDSPIKRQPVTARGVMGYPVHFAVQADNVASFQWQYSKNGTTWLKSGAASATNAVVQFVLAEANKNNTYRCKITTRDGGVFYTDPVGIHVHDLYYGYDPTDFGPNGLEVTSEHYIYCKSCILRRDYEAHTWDSPAEACSCLVCGAHKYPDMFGGNAPEQKVPLDSEDAARIGNEYCNHENASVHFGPAGYSLNCFNCGYTESGNVE